MFDVLLLLALLPKEKSEGGSNFCVCGYLPLSYSPTRYSCHIIVNLGAVSILSVDGRIRGDLVVLLCPYVISSILGRRRTKLHQRRTITPITFVRIMSIPTSLTKQILQLNHPHQKFSNEAIELTSEFMKLFIIEARRRASIEVCLVVYMICVSVHIWFQ